MPRVLTQGMATVVSVWPRPINTRHPVHDFDMDAAPDCTTHSLTGCAECIPYASKVVFDRKQGMDIGFNKSVPIDVHAGDLAEDYIRGSYGTFVLDGDSKPTRKQLEDAREQMVAYLSEAVHEADGSWNRYHDSKLIPESARIGVKILGLKREWLSDTSSKKQCDSCGDFVPVTVIKCKCGAVYDWQKAFERGMLTKDQVEMAKESGLIAIPEPVKRGPGRPPKEVSL